MSIVVGSVRAEFAADTTDFESGTKRAAESLKRVGSAAENAQTPLGKLSATAKKSDESSRRLAATLSKVAGSYVDVNGRLRDATGNLLRVGAEMDDVQGKGTHLYGVLKTVGDRVDRLKRKQLGLVDALARADKAFAGDRLKIAAVRKELERTTKALQKFETKGVEQSLLRTKIPLGVVAAGFAAVTAAARLAASSFSGFADLELQLVRTNSMINKQGKSGAQSLALLEERSRSLGSTTAWTSTQVAEGMQFMAMAGADLNTTVAAMPSILQLATAAQMDLGATSDIVTNIMTTFGIATDQLNRSNDTLMATTSSSNTSLGQMAAALKFVGPQARGLGVDLRETAAAIGVLGNAGLQGEMAGTILRNALISMIAPSGKAKKAMDDLKLSSDAATKGFRYVVEVLEEQSKSMSKLEFQGNLVTLFGKRAGPGMASLVAQGTDAIDGLLQKIDGADGLTAAMEKDVLGTMDGKMRLLTSAVDELSKAFAQSFAPALTDAITELTLFIGAFDSAGQAFLRTLSFFTPMNAVWNAVEGDRGGALGKARRAADDRVALAKKLGDRLEVLRKERDALLRDEDYFGSFSSPESEAGLLAASEGLLDNARRIKNIQGRFAELDGKPRTLAPPPPSPATFTPPVGAATGTGTGADTGTSTGKTTSTARSGMDVVRDLEAAQSFADSSKSLQSTIAAKQAELDKNMGKLTDQMSWTAKSAEELGVSTGLAGLGLQNLSDVTSQYTARTARAASEFERAVGQVADGLAVMGEGLASGRYLQAAANGNLGATAGGDVGGLLGGLAGGAIASLFTSGAGVTAGAGVGSAAGSVLGSVMGDYLDELAKSLGVLTPLFDAAAVAAKSYTPLLLVLRDLSAALAKPLETYALVLTEIIEPVAALTQVFVRIVEVGAIFTSALFASIASFTGFYGSVTDMALSFDAAVMRPMVSSALAIYNVYAALTNMVLRVISVLSGAVVGLGKLASWIAAPFIDFAGWIAGFAAPLVRASAAIYDFVAGLARGVAIWISDAVAPMVRAGAFFYNAVADWVAGFARKLEQWGIDTSGLRMSTVSTNPDEFFARADDALADNAAATRENTSAVRDFGRSVTNVPTGYRVQLAEYRAETPNGDRRTAFEQIVMSGTVNFLMMNEDIAATVKSQMMRQRGYPVAPRGAGSRSN